MENRSLFLEKCWLMVQLALFGNLQVTAIYKSKLRISTKSSIIIPQNFEKIHIFKIHIYFPSSQYLLQKQPPEVSLKRCVLKNYAKFTRKYLCKSFFFNKVEGCAIISISKKFQGSVCSFIKRGSGAGIFL